MSFKTKDSRFPAFYSLFNLCASAALLVGCGQNPHVTADRQSLNPDVVSSAAEAELQNFAQVPDAEEITSAPPQEMSPASPQVVREFYVRVDKQVVPSKTFECRVDNVHLNQPKFDGLVPFRMSTWYLDHPNEIPYESCEIVHYFKRGHNKNISTGQMSIIAGQRRHEEPDHYFLECISRKQGVYTRIPIVVSPETLAGVEVTAVAQVVNKGKTVKSKPLNNKKVEDLFGEYNCFNFGLSAIAGFNSQACTNKKSKIRIRDAAFNLGIGAFELGWSGFALTPRSSVGCGDPFALPFDPETQKYAPYHNGGGKYEIVVPVDEMSQLVFVKQ